MTDLNFSDQRRRLLAKLMTDSDRDASDFPASQAQRRQWLLHQLAPDASGYTMPVAVRLRAGSTSRPCGWRSPTSHRGTSRCVPRSRCPTATAARSSACTPSRQSRSRCATAPATPRLSLAEELRAAVEEPFDLAGKGPAAGHRVAAGHRRHVLLVAAHHIVADGWSADIVLRDLAAAYQARRRGVPPALPALPIQPADYAVGRPASCPRPAWASTSNTGVPRWTAPRRSWTCRPSGPGRRRPPDRRGRCTRCSTRRPSNECVGSPGSTAAPSSRCCSPRSRWSSAGSPDAPTWWSGHPCPVGSGARWPTSSAASSTRCPSGCAGTTGTTTGELLAHVREQSTAAQRHQLVPLQLLVEQLVRPVSTPERRCSTWCSPSRTRCDRPCGSTGSPVEPVELGRPRRSSTSPVSWPGPGTGSTCSGSTARTSSTRAPSPRSPRRSARWPPRCRRTSTGPSANWTWARAPC